MEVCTAKILWHTSVRAASRWLDAPRAVTDPSHLSPGHHVDGGSLAVIFRCQGLPSGSVCTRSPSPPNNPCTACTAQARGSVLSSACGPRRAQRSGACRTQDTALRDRDNWRSTRHPVSAKAAQGHVGRAYACSKPRRQARQLPYVPPWRAPQQHERMRHRSTDGTWWSSDMIVSNVLVGKPLGFWGRGLRSYCASWVRTMIRALSDSTEVRARKWVPSRGLKS